MREICATLRELASQAYQQKLFAYFGALTDARRLLLSAYLPAESCAFCGELFTDCHCDEVQQSEKDE